MNGPLPVKAHLRGGTCIVLALLQVAKLKRDAVHNVDARGSRSSHCLCLGIMIERELLAHGVARTNVAGIIDYAKNQASQPWG